MVKCQFNSESDQDVSSRSDQDDQTDKGSDNKAAQPNSKGTQPDAKAPPNTKADQVNQPASTAGTADNNLTQDIKSMESAFTDVISVGAKSWNDFWNSVWGF